jgi:membrane-associated phospholipid phosphatase
MASLAEALGLLRVFAFAVLGVAAYVSWRPGVRGRTAAVLCLSVFAAIAINTTVKLAYGRTWLESWMGNNPSWICDGVFGSFPFHGGPEWGSFPLGHTTIVATTANILWLVWPELRVVWGAIVAMVAASLIAGNYHFLSDIIGGFYLGVAVGS